MNSRAVPLIKPGFHIVVSVVSVVPKKFIGQIALWKPPVQMLNTKETTDTTIWKPGLTTLTTSTIKTESIRLLTEKVRMT